MDMPTCLELFARWWLKKHTALVSQGARVRGRVISCLFIINVVLLAIQSKERREWVRFKLNPILSTRDAAVGTVSSLRTGPPKNNVVISVRIKTCEGCPEIIQPFWISREPVAWPWCNLASQRRPYCASVNSHSPVGLVSRQWDAVDWACVLFDCRIYNDRASGSANLHQCACPFYSSGTGFFFEGGGQNIASSGPVSTPTAQIWLSATSGISQS